MWARTPRQQETAEFLNASAFSESFKSFHISVEETRWTQPFIFSSMGIKQMHRQTCRYVKAAVIHGVFADTQADVTPGTKADLCHSLKIIPPSKLSCGEICTNVKGRGGLMGL